MDKPFIHNPYKTSNPSTPYHYILQHITFSYMRGGKMHQIAIGQILLVLLINAGWLNVAMNIWINVWRTCHWTICYAMSAGEERCRWIKVIRCTWQAIRKAPFRKWHSGTCTYAMYLQNNNNKVSYLFFWR